MKGNKISSSVKISSVIYITWKTCYIMLMGK